MSDDNTFEYAEKTTVKELSEYLMKLADGFKNQYLELQSKGQTIALNPEEKVKLEVKAKGKEEEGELELEISWKRDTSDEHEKLEIISESGEITTQ